MRQSESKVFDLVDNLRRQSKQLALGTAPSLDMHLVQYIPK